MSTWSFNKADNIEDTVDEIIKQIGWIMGKLDSKNVKRLDTNETVIKSKSGKTYIHGPILEMDDTNIRRLNMGLNESTNEFMFELYNEAGTKTVSIDSDGKGVFNQVTLRNDLVGSAYVNISTSGLVCYNGSVKTIEVGSDGNATFKQVTLRNDLTGDAYISINSTGIIANDGTKNTFEINSNGNAYYRGDVSIGANINVDTDVRVGQHLRMMLNTDIAATLRAAATTGGTSLLIGADFAVSGGLLTPTYLDRIDIFLGRMYLYGDMTISEELNVSGTVNFNDASSISGLITGSYGGHDHGIPNGTVLMVDGGGTVTFNSVTDHWHTVVTS